MTWRKNVQGAVLGLSRCREVHEAHVKILCGVCDAIFVFDVNNRATFEHLEDWIRQVEKNGPVLKVLVGNKVDDNSRGTGREVTAQEASICG